MRTGRQIAGTLALAALGCGSAPSGPASPTPIPGPRVGPSGFEYNGVTHVSWWHDEYLGSEASISRDALATATRANWAGVLVTWYMDTRTSIEIGADPRQTPSDAAVEEAIRDLHGRGLKVMLKPHVDVKDGTWRGQIAPRDAATWFASYRGFISRYAALAEASSVELFNVGTELVSLSDSRYAAAWAQVITSVRAVYRGPLTYSANANIPGDEYTSVSFWDLLDVTGLDVYVSLTRKNDPAPAELAQAWTSDADGQNMVAAYRNWQASHGKPVIFAEIGYRSVDGANTRPWDFSFEGPPDPAEQADCYEAALEVWSRESSWMRGTFWWDWPVAAPGPDDTDYTPRDKPAVAVLQHWYSP